jgi:hypothetical protein
VDGALAACSLSRRLRCPSILLERVCDAGAGDG